MPGHPYDPQAIHAPHLEAGVFFLTQPQWDRLWRYYHETGKACVYEPTAHPMTKAGHALVWCWDVGMWAGCSPHAQSAVLRQRARDEAEIAAAHAGA